MRISTPRRLLLIALILLFSLLLSGSGEGERGGGETPLVGTRWSWVGAVRQGGDFLPGEAYLRLEEEGATVRGSTGCGTFSGSYQLTVNRGIHFSPLLLSPNGECVDEGEMIREQEIMESLRLASRYEVRLDTLILYQGLRPLARWRAETLPDSP